MAFTWQAAQFAAALTVSSTALLVPCRCPEVTLERYFERADVVVVARVRGTRHVAADSAGGASRIEVDVVPLFRQGRTFKGSLTGVVLATPEGSASCGVPIVAGRDYVLFASRDSATSLAWFDTCSGARAYPTSDSDPSSPPFLGTPHQAVITQLMTLAEANERSTVAQERTAAPEFFTSPACWQTARVAHIGAPPAEWRARVRVSRFLPADGDSSGIVSPNNAYRAQSAHQASSNGMRALAQVRIVTDRPSGVLVEARDAVDAPGIRWVNEKLLFARIPWSRVQFTDVLIDVETAQPLYEEWALFGEQAMRQYREGCLGQCPCDAIPGSADSSNTSPQRTAATGEARGFDELTARALVYLDEDWDGRVYSNAGGTRWVQSRLKGALGREEYPADILERRLVNGTWWLNVALYRESRCTNPNAVPVHTGWVPAYSARGRLVGRTWTRGC